MSTVYKVRANPTYDNGSRSLLAANSRVHIKGSTHPDDEGDVKAYPEGGDPANWNYVALSCLLPVAPSNDVERVSVRALRAALAMGDGSPEDIDSLVRVVTIIDAAYLD